MATDPDFAEFVVDQLASDCQVTHRKMFGEYALYAGGKVVALICDNRLFVKPTEAGRKLIGTPVEAPPYPGGRPSFLIEDRIEDRVWLSELIRVTTEELPLPKSKPRSKSKPAPKAPSPSRGRPAARKAGAPPRKRAPRTKRR